VAGGRHGQPQVLPEGSRADTQHRYVLESLLNGKVTATIQNALTFATSKFDEQFVNGIATDAESEDLKKSLCKQRRLNFAIEKEEIIGRLH
jgi:hypothetical protein